MNPYLSDAELRELKDAALALPYWPGSRTPENYAPPLLRFLRAIDAVREEEDE